MAVDPTAVLIDFSRDKLFDLFTLQTIQERYMVPGETSPQEAFARACAAFGDDPDHAQYLYDCVSKGWFMFATPLLSNGGTARGLPISCFLSVAEDSREGIFAHYTETGWLSSVGGGVGGYWPLRSNGERTSHGSATTGMMGFVPVVDRLILAVSQGDTRRGSYAAYADISHPEIEEFIVGRKPTGGAAERKFTNLHNAVNITDEFMIAVRDDTQFNLRDLHSGRVTKTMRARDLWRLIIDTRMQTGEPYLHFVDTSNRAMPEGQKKKGLRIHQSNLCVSPQTELLTDVGYKPIVTLSGSPTKIWNGEAWEQVVVEHTGEDMEMIRVWFDDGSHLDVTPYHKFYDADGVCYRAADLRPGMLLEAQNHPVIDLPSDAFYDIDTAYTAGWATLSGFEDKNRIAAYASHAVPDSALKRLMQRSVDIQTDEDGGSLIRYEPGTIPAGRAPMRWALSARLAWLGGALDAAGAWIDLGEEGRFLGFATDDADLVQELRLVALESGLLSPRIRVTDTGCGFMLNEFEVSHLIHEGYLLRFEAPMGPSIRFHFLPKVADVHALPWRSDTFCFTAPARGRGVFNGILTGNCTEIMLPTGRDNDDKMRTAVCCLSSVNAEKFHEWRHDPRFIPAVMRMLDNALQVFIDKAPAALANAVYSAMMERSVGLGALGFHAALQNRLIPFESEEARLFNISLFTHMRQGADETSRELAIERGEAPDMIGYGERFSHKLALAPNASSSILCGNTSPSTEPWRANAYLHKTTSGSFSVKNRALERELDKLGMNTAEVWKSIIANEGSVQHLVIPGLLKKVFKTATEIDQIWIIIHAADRKDLIDQGQSVNVFFEHDADAGAINKVHYLAWEWGVKSLYYLRSTTPKRAENTNTAVNRVVMADAPAIDLGALVMNAGAMDESTCVACEG